MSEDQIRKEIPIENGVQPLHALMDKLAISNHDLVASYDGQLTHKTVMKARRGRKISRQLQLKVLQAFNSRLMEVHPELESKVREDLFNYGY